MAISVVADTILKPLKWMTKSVDDLAVKILQKIPNFVDEVLDALIHASEVICRQGWIPQWIKNGIAKMIISFTINIKSIFAKAIVKEPKPLIEFMEEGASGAGTSYDSFNAFKKANPTQTQGNHWHHIVEQSQQGKSGFSVQQINNTNNLIELTPSQHSQITGYYNTKSFQFTNGLSVRDWLAGQSFEVQYKFGIDKLKEFGIIK